MAVRRLYARLGDCGYTLEYVDEMYFERAMWQVENLDRLDNERTRVALVVASATMADEKGWKTIDRGIPKHPWRDETRKAKMLRPELRAEADRVERELRERTNGV